MRTVSVMRTFRTLVAGVVLVLFAPTPAEAAVAYNVVTSYTERTEYVSSSALVPVETTAYRSVTETVMLPVTSTTYREEEVTTFTTVTETLAVESVSYQRVPVTTYQSVTSTVYQSVATTRRVPVTTTQRVPVYASRLQQVAVSRQPVHSYVCNHSGGTAAPSSTARCRLSVVTTWQSIPVYQNVTYISGYQTITSTTYRTETVYSTVPVTTTRLVPVTTYRTEPVVTIRYVTSTRVVPVTTIRLVPVTTTTLQPVSRTALVPVTTTLFQLVPDRTPVTTRVPVFTQVPYCTEPGEVLPLCAPTTTTTTTTTTGTATTVVPQVQTVSFSLTPMNVGASQGLFASAATTVSYRSSTPLICTVNGPTLIAVASGQCRVTADAVATSSHQAASASATALVSEVVTVVRPT